MSNVIPLIRTWDDRPVEAVPLPSMQRHQRIARIQDVVALSYDIAPSHMRSSCRQRSLAWPRQVAMYLARELTQHSFPMIGRHFGGRDHSTVMKALKAVESRMDAEPLYRADVDALREALA